jgi:ureidoacrylate peracid hydrolase
MHPSELPAATQARIVQRRGKLHLYEFLDPAATALVVIDLQVGFMAEGAAAEVPVARAIVPNVNALARATRAAGGTVAWVQMTLGPAAEDYWVGLLDHVNIPARAEPLRQALTAGQPGHEIWPGLEVQEGDLRARKNRYSAFLPGASDLAEQLEARGIDTLLIAGTLTNVCCESSARDAMMRDFKVIMVSDANAALEDDDHVASLSSLALVVGDVYTSDELIALLGG